MKKFLYFAFLLLSFDIFAAANYRSASITPDSIKAYDEFTLEVEINGNGSDWEAIYYEINGVGTCLNESSLTTKVRTYTITAPGSAGVFPIDIQIFGNSRCRGTSSSGSVNLIVQSEATSSHQCAAVWSTEFTNNYSGDFQLLQDLDNASTDYSLIFANDFDWPTGVYVADTFTLENAQLGFTGTDPVTIYANEVVIEQSILNQSNPNPLIIIAKEVEITGSQVHAAIFIMDDDSEITGSSITGALTASVNLDFTYDNDAGNDNNLYFDEFYFDDANFGGECSNSSSSTDHTFLDRFNSVAYDNNDGEEDFVNDWNEDGDDDSPSSGDIQIINGRLHLQGDDESIRREVRLDLYSTAVLSFDYEMITSYTDDDVYLQIRTDNRSWTTLKTFEGEVDEGSGTFSIDISGYLEFDVDIRFLTASGFDSNDDFYIDNFAIDVDNLALSCPDTSGYTDIYTVDFSSDSGVWQTTDFTRTVSVWPGDSIENDSYEDQTVDYVVTGGQMVVEGANGGNSDGNNEYGAVLHDLSTERYEPDEITEYSIEVDMYPGASSVVNNDAGVVFGYQNDNNYYVLKWTKYGTVFENDSDYPGDYQDLDLIKVENGTATKLGSKNAFVGTDPMRIKITVNADGIQICIDGDGTLLASSEQPPIYKYGFFTYENEEGVSFDDLVVKCVGCVQTPACPSTAAYDLIFDDNFDTTPNNNWQAVTLDRNNVNVWPGDSIYSNSEEQSVMFAVSGGTMNIAGGISSGGDNEFGVVLHDVDDEGYDNSTIDTYSINTNFTSNSSQSNNNDAGLIFGYQDSSNFYLLNWVKFAQNYASDTTFPGTHRNLEVIKVVNGVPTQVGVEENFYANDDIAIKVTVNSDGITVCVNGDNLIQVASERPYLGQVGFFSYDNDYGVSFDDFQVWCESCSLSGGVDHYRIVHPTSGLTCASYDVSVYACEDASCSSYSTETVTGNLRKVVGASTTDIMALNTSTGSQTQNFAHTSSGTISFDLINQNPAASNANVCVTGSVSGATTTCEMVLAESGFVVSVSDFESAIGWQQVNVQALEDDGSQTCAPAFQGDQPVNIDFDYLAPTVAQGAIAKTLEFSSSGSGAADNSLISGSGLNTDLNFSAVDAIATFYINYLDAGQLRLSVSDSNGVLLTGSNDFVVYPTALNIEMNDGASYLGASGNETHYAEQAFNLIITAVNASGDATENYRPGDLYLSPYLLTPLSANTTTFDYSSLGTLLVDYNTTNWQSVSLLFDRYGYNTSDASFNEVGSFELDAFDDNYYGYDINATAASAGRFTPYYFTVATDRVGELQASGTGYTYIGEEMTYFETPRLEFVAKSFEGNTTLNYQSFVPTFSDRSYVEETVGTNFNGGDTSAGMITVTEGADFDGDFFVELSDDTFTYLKTASVASPFTSQLTLRLSVADLTDSDGIGYCSGDNPSDCPVTYEPYDMPLTASVEMRYGRVYLQNASGSEEENLLVPAFVQYWDGSAWIINSQDSTTLFGNLTGNITNASDGSATTFVLDVDQDLGNTFVAGEVQLGDGLFVEHQSTVAELILTLDNVPAWLNIDWDGDGDIDSDDMVSSSVIFGRFKGNDRIIYKRER